mgnify:CR=1 FL=1|jgi:Lysophospholipase
MNALRRFLMSILTILVLSYTGFCLFLWLNQERMIFFPTVADAAELSGIAESENLDPWRAPDGTPIGWKSRNTTPDALLVLHGNAGYALHRNYEAFRTSGTPLQIYLLEYPGYGARQGPPSERALVDATVEAIDAIPADQRVFLFGQSLGSGVACAAAAQRPDRVAGIVLVTPFDSLASAASFHYPWLPVRWLIRHRFDSARNLTRYHGPVAFIIAERDGTVPAKLGQRLYDSYAGPKKLWLIPDAGHNDMDSLLADWPGIIGWLQSSAR